MCHVVRAAELYPSPETITDQPGLQPPYHPIIGEFILYLGEYYYLDQWLPTYALLSPKGSHAFQGK